ncbi:MAG: SCO1664 family protein [Chloroflexi bacterium]|nr:SCO1664 family protein [Chloroflexota bacterium]
MRRWSGPATSALAGTATTSTDPALLAHLREAPLHVLGRLPGSTNNALLVAVGDGAAAIVAVYKPAAGERPLFDFPTGTLAHREVAAFLASEAGGWGIVPPTVLRDGPFGEGMVQQWIDIDPAVDVVAMVVDDDPRLRPIAVFDAAVNNTDRKGGHLLPTVEGGLFGVDHGVTFSTQPKLRTVLWGWQGEPFSDAEREPLERLRASLARPLAIELVGLLDAAEIGATRRRVAALLRSGRFPRPRSDWPAVPWPPF